MRLLYKIAKVLFFMWLVFLIAVFNDPEATFDILLVILNFIATGDVATVPH